MKNQSQAAKRGSKSAAVSQVQTARKSIRSSAERTAGDEQSTSLNPSSTREELEAYLTMRGRKLKSPVRLCLAVADDGEQSDVRLAEYLGEVIAIFGEDLWDHVISKLDDPREVAQLGEVISIAWEVYRNCIDREKRKERGQGDVNEFVTSFHLPGLAAKQDHGSAAAVLDYLAFAIDPHRAVIRQQIIEPDSDPIGKIMMSEALVIAQAVVDRAGGDAEIEHCDRIGTYTQLTQLSWQIKADFYSEKLRKSSAERAASREADRQMVARRAVS